MQQKVIPPEPEVRMMRREDLAAVVEIDAGASGRKRPEYYERKIAMALDDSHQLVTSMVMELDGRLVGFIMGEVYLGEFGIPEARATIDTIGVAPEYRSHGVGSTLFKAYVAHLREIGVHTVVTQTRWNDWDLLHFFEKVGFEPAHMVNLEMQIG